jgi:rod shape-determining protein MreD
MRLGFVLLAGLILFVHLLPLDTVPRVWAPPDLLLAFTFAWILRRPDYLPLLLLAGVLLLADLLLQRPPGLLAALVILGCEYLKNRFHSLSDASFAGEWAAVSIVLLAIMVMNRVVLTVLGVDLAPLGLTVIQAVLTLMVYPLVVLVTQALMGVRKPAPGDAEAYGMRT